MLPYVLAFAAGEFLYVAMADLIPNLHRGGIDRNAVRQTVLIALGVGTIILMTQLVRAVRPGDAGWHCSCS